MKLMQELAGDATNATVIATNATEVTKTRKRFTINAKQQYV
jgi:hypothetical protein